MRKSFARLKSEPLSRADLRVVEDIYNGCVGFKVRSEDCVFCRIVNGELPSLKIVENDTILGILDTNPTGEGHCLIIPKRHVRYWHDLSDEETSIIFNTAKIVARRMKKVLGPDFVCVFIRGGRVKHLHIVLFPSNEGDMLSGFPQSILGTAQVDLARVQEKLQVRQ